MATFSAAFSSAASCSGVKPVEPMTRAGPPFSAAFSARATEASGVEKSMITSHRDRSAVSPQSKRAATTTSSRASRTWDTARPIRPR